MADLYKVVFTGNLLESADPEAVVEQFATRFGCGVEKAQSLFDAKKEVVLKSGVEAEKAAKYEQALQSIGVGVRVEAMEPQGSKLSLEPIEGEGEEGEDEGASVRMPTCPKCGSENIQGDDCRECGIIISKYQAQVENGSVATVTFHKEEEKGDTDNPYQAPSANLQEEFEDGDLTGPKSVSAGRGWSWLTEGFGYFRKNPWAWILALVVWFVISIVLTIIPLVGSLGLMIISPVIGAGFMIGCRVQDEGGDFTVSHLFSGFKSNVGQLLLVGVLYIVGSMVIMFGVFAVIGVGGAAFMDPSMAEDPEAVSAMMSSMVLPMLIAAALFIPLVMAYWFAAPLVALNDLSAISAMKMSFMGCLKNILPFLIYGLAAMLFVFVGALPFGLGLLVVMPMVIASMYVAYRDIFYG